MLQNQDVHFLKQKIRVLFLSLQMFRMYLFRRRIVGIIKMVETEMNICEVVCAYVNTIKVTLALNECNYCILV